MSVQPDATAPLIPGYMHDAATGLWYRIGVDAPPPAPNEVVVDPADPSADPAVEIWVDTDDNTGGMPPAPVGGQVPIGGILAFGGAAPPAGYHLCDGTAHGSAELATLIGPNTPDLRGLFIAGAGGAYGVGAKGGADTVTLTVEQMPPHSHTSPTGAGLFGAYNGVNQDLLSTSGTHGTLYGTTSITGGGMAHENRPPFYALTYIIRAS